MGIKYSFACMDDYVMNIAFVIEEMKLCCWRKGNVLYALIAFNNFETLSLIICVHPNRYI